MPFPVYMVCCLSGAVDKDSNQISHFNVIEQLRLNIAKYPAGKSEGMPIGAPLTFQVVSTWARDAKDNPNDPYEAELLLKRPEDNKPKVLHRSEFKFAKRNHRFLFNFQLAPSPSAESGVFAFENRIRKSGGRKWLRQAYLIPIEVVIVEDKTSQDYGQGKRGTKKTLN